MKTKININQKGFSLVELMIATAIWSVVALGTGYGIVQVQRSQQEAAGKNMTLNMKTNLSSYINSGMLCEKLLKDRTLPSTNSNEFIEIVNNQTEELNQLLLESDEGVRTKKTKVDGIFYRVKDNSPLPGEKFKTVLIDGQTQKIKTVEFQIAFSYLKPGIRDEDEEEETENYTSVSPMIFDVPVYTDANDKFITCNQDMSMAETCSSLGYSYSATEKKCTSTKDMCIFGDIFAVSALMDVSDAAEVNAKIQEAGGTDKIKVNVFAKAFGVLGRAVDLMTSLFSPTGKGLLSTLDQGIEEGVNKIEDDELGVYQNLGEIDVKCITPNANGGLGCKCQPGFEAREASFFNKNRTVSCGKKCTNEVNLKMRSFMCIKCQKR